MEVLKKVKNCFKNARATMFMVIIQAIFAGVNVLYKLAVNDGMSPRIIVAYRFAFAAAFMLPLALVVERERPKLTGIVLLQAFFCGVLGGSLAQNLFIESLKMTSATFVSATTNLVPAITLLLGVCFRLEKFGFQTVEGKAKIMGIILGMSGAMILTFYKGVRLITLSSSHMKVHAAHHGSNQQLVGALLALGSCVSYALWMNMQAKIMETYPYYYTCTALMCTMAALQATLFALCLDRDPNHWKLGWDIRLLTVSYSGILASGLMVTLMAWCVQKRGPLFASIFNPLMLVLVALGGGHFLDENIYLGSAIGVALIVLGLYVVLWSKGKEKNKAIPQESEQ